MLAHAITCLSLRLWCVRAGRAIAVSLSRQLPSVCRRVRLSSPTGPGSLRASVNRCICTVLYSASREGHPRPPLLTSSCATAVAVLFGRPYASLAALAYAPGIGAGVYFPPQAANEDDERGVPIVPAGDSHPQNTINRAELVGILAALRHGAHMIATDSLSSMYQIKKMLRRPQDLLNHQHRELIKEIVTEIVNRGLRTTLHKVKGHASIIGNEKADAIAKAAATGDTFDYEECEKYESPSNNRLTQYWPHKTQWNNRWSRTNGQRTLIDRFKRVNPLTDLHDSVRHYCHQKSRFGMANRATCYFEAFKRIEERLDLPASNEYMTSGKIKYAERKTALRYRYGTMWTRKMAYRCGHAPSSKCLLCGDEDGGHHTASGCPALKRMYINRHNKVGRLIMTREGTQRSICHSNGPWIN